MEQTDEGKNQPIIQISPVGGPLSMLSVALDILEFSARKTPGLFLKFPKLKERRWDGAHQGEKEKEKRRKRIERAKLKGV